MLALGWSFGALAAAVYAAVVKLPLLTLYYLRFDLLPTMLTTIAIAAYRRGLPVSAAVALVAGIRFKFWPLPLSRIVRQAMSRRRRATGYRRVRSALGAPRCRVDRSRWRRRPRSGRHVPWRNRLARRKSRRRVHRLVEPAEPAARGRRMADWLPRAVDERRAARARGGRGERWLAWNGASNRGQLGVTWLASVTALLLIAPALSPQYMVWLAPAIAISLERRRSLARAAHGRHSAAHALVVIGIWRADRRSTMGRAPNHFEDSRAGRGVPRGRSRHLADQDRPRRCGGSPLMRGTAAPERERTASNVSRFTWVSQSENACALCARGLTPVR